MKNRANPILTGLSQETVFETRETATVRGVFTKSLLSVLVFVAAMVITMSTPILLRISMSPIFLIVGLIITFSMIFKIAKNPLGAKNALYFYAIFEGMVLASTVLVLNYLTQTNVGLLAGGIVVVIFITMLFVYVSFPNFYDRVSPLLSVFMLVALGLMVLNLFAMIFGQGITFGSGLDLFLTLGFAVLAAFSYLRDFRTIDQVVKGKLPKEYEYVAAFGLLTTTIWLYVEILRLLSILMSRRD